MTTPGRRSPQYRGLPPHDFPDRQGEIPAGPGIRALINASAPNVPPELAERLTQGKSLADLLQGALIQGGNELQPTPGIGVGPSGTLNRQALVMDENGNVVDYNQEGFPVRTFKQAPRTRPTGRTGMMELLNAAGSADAPNESLYQMQGNQRVYTKGQVPTDRSLTALFINALKTNNTPMVQAMSEWWRGMPQEAQIGVLTRLVQEAADQGANSPSRFEPRELPSMVKFIEQTLRTGKLDPDTARTVQELMPYESLAGSFTERPSTGKAIFNEEGGLEDTGYTQDYFGDLVRSMEAAEDQANGLVDVGDLNLLSFEDLVRANPGPLLPAPGNVARLDPAALVKSYTDLDDQGNPINYGTPSTVNEEYYDPSKVLPLQGTKKAWKDIPYKTSVQLQEVPPTPEALRAWKEAGIKYLADRGLLDIAAGTDLSQVSNETMDALLAEHRIPVAPKPKQEYRVYQGADLTRPGKDGNPPTQIDPKSIIPRKDLWSWENGERMGDWYESDMDRGVLNALQERFKAGGRTSMKELEDGKVARDRWLVAKNAEGQWDMIDPNDPDITGLPPELTHEMRQQLVDQGVEQGVPLDIVRVQNEDGSVGFELYDEAKHGNKSHGTPTWNLNKPILDLNFTYTGPQYADSYENLPLDGTQRSPGWKQRGFDDTSAKTNALIRQNHTRQQRLTDFVRNGLADPSNPENAYSIVRFLLRGRKDLNPITPAEGMKSPLKGADADENLELLANLVMTRLPELFQDANSRVVQREALKQLFENAYIDNAPNPLDGARGGSAARKAAEKSRLKEVNERMRQDALRAYEEGKDAPEAPPVEFPEGQDSIPGAPPPEFKPGKNWQTPGRSWLESIMGGNHDDNIQEALKIINGHLSGQQVDAETLEGARSYLNKASMESNDDPISAAAWEQHGDAINKALAGLKSKTPSYTNPEAGNVTSAAESDADGSAKLAAASPSGTSGANTSAWPDPTQEGFNFGEHGYTTGGAKGRTPSTTMLKDMTVAQLKAIAQKRWWSQNTKNGGRWPKGSPQDKAWQEGINKLIAEKEAAEAGGKQLSPHLPKPQDGPSLPNADHRKLGIPDDEMVSEADAASMLGVSVDTLRSAVSGGRLTAYGDTSAPQFHLKELNMLSQGGQQPKPADQPDAQNQTQTTTPKPKRTPGQVAISDEQYNEAVQHATKEGRVTVNMLQGRMGIGYNKAKAIVARMQSEGVLNASNKLVTKQADQDAGQAPDPDTDLTTTHEEDADGSANLDASDPSSKTNQADQNSGQQADQDADDEDLVDDDAADEDDADVADDEDADVDADEADDADMDGDEDADVDGDGDGADVEQEEAEEQPAAAGWGKWLWDQTGGRAMGAGRKTGQVIYNNPKKVGAAAAGLAGIAFLAQDDDPYGSKRSGIGRGLQPGGGGDGQGGAGQSMGRPMIRSGKTWSEMSPEERIRDMKGWFNSTPGLLPQTLQRKS